MFYYPFMQLAFGFMGGRPVDSGGERRPDRYFFALLPDPDTALRIDRQAHELRRSLRLKGAPRGTGKYHVTLWRLPASDGPDGQDVAAARRAAGSIRHGPFAMAFDQAADFGPAWKPALVLMATDEQPAANRLHQTIGEALRHAGIKAGAQSFRPHVTLLYDRRRLAPFGVPQLNWQVRDFALVRSVDHEQYDILGRWPLHG